MEYDMSGIGIILFDVILLCACWSIHRKLRVMELADRKSADKSAQDIQWIQQFMQNNLGRKNSTCSGKIAIAEQFSITD